MISARLLLLVGVLGIISQPPRMAGDEPSTGEVVLRIIAPGGPPPQQVKVVLRNVDSQEVLHLNLWATPGTDSIRMSHVPLGRYSLTAISGVLATQKDVKLQVGSATKYQSVCLSLQGPFDRFGPAPKTIVSGRVLLGGAASPQKYWISFFGVCSDTRYEVETDRQGIFSLDGVEAGVYLMIASGGQGVSTARRVTIWPGKNNFEIE